MWLLLLLLRLWVTIWDILSILRVLLLHVGMRRCLMVIRNRLLLLLLLRVMMRLWWSSHVHLHSWHLLV